MESSFFSSCEGKPIFTKDASIFVVVAGGWMCANKISLKKEKIKKNERKMLQ